ncbi:MAG TPA: hypothetical protein VLK59_16870 [Solirubrobacteraceae bacterium]|nr:hypothetical protein [Solirubrobacteraceae bacterium]
MRKVVSVAFAVIAAAGLWVTPALADGPGVGTPAVVSVGDSAISGEAGRWAGNTNGSPSNVDALGSGAYNDSGSAEAIHGCHRSKASEIGIGIGGDVASANLACSGARTYTQPFSSGSDFKPGLDFYDDGAGHIGQAKALQQYAAAHNVKLVVALIGANDYGFADIVQQCVTDWLTSPSWWKNYCHDDSSMTSKFTAANVAAVTTRVTNAFLNLRTAMRNAGYADGSWTLLAQTYSSPLPRGSGIRYSQSGFTRQTTGGCGVWNADADWANDTVVATLNGTVRNAKAATGMSTIALFDAQNALVGHRLCENTDGLLEEQGLASWHSAGAADRSEWVSQIRTATTLVGPYQLQEDAHPSYWGQLALRNCLRQAYNAGAPRAGTCSRTTTGLDAQGEPNMSFG